MKDLYVRGQLCTNDERYVECLAKHAYEAAGVSGDCERNLKFYYTDCGYVEIEFDAGGAQDGVEALSYNVVGASEPVSITDIHNKHFKTQYEIVRDGRDYIDEEVQINMLVLQIQGQEAPR